MIHLGDNSVTLVYTPCALAPSPLRASRATESWFKHAQCAGDISKQVDSRDCPSHIEMAMRPITGIPCR